MGYQKDGKFWLKQQPVQVSRDTQPSLAWLHFLGLFFVMQV